MAHKRGFGLGFFCEVSCFAFLKLGKLITAIKLRKAVKAPIKAEHYSSQLQFIFLAIHLNASFK